MPGAVCVGGVDGVILLTIIYAQSNFICLLTCSTPSSILVVLKVQAASKLFMYIWVFHTLDICPVPPASFIMAKAGFIQVIFLWWKIVGHRSVAYNSGVFKVTITLYFQEVLYHSMSLPIYAAFYSMTMSPSFHINICYYCVLITKCTEQKQLFKAEQKLNQDW